MLRVRVCVAHIGGSFGLKLSKQGSLQIGQWLRLRGDCLGSGNEVGHILVGQNMYDPVLRKNVPTRTSFFASLFQCFYVNMKNYNICYILLYSITMQHYKDDTTRSKRQCLPVGRHIKIYNEIDN